MAKHVLSDRFCREAPHPEAGQVLYFDGHKDAPAGFALRVTPGAKSWTLNYYVGGKQRRMTLPVGFPAWGPKRARIEAAKAKTAIHAGADPLAEREAAKEAEREAKAQQAAKSKHTLGGLLLAYCLALESAGKPSAHKVRKAVERHVEAAHPELWAKPAADLEPEDAVEIVGALVQAGKDREASKLRATLRAAYAMGVRARLDAKASPAIRAFKLKHNPVADMAPVEGGTGGTRERVLSVDELRHYWRRILALPDPDGALLRLHLLTGCQRVEQLARATAADIAADDATLRLWDGKGRRSKPRAHVVPLLPEAMQAIDALRGDKGPNIVTTDKGKSGIGYHVLQHRVRLVSAAMVEAKEASEPFTPGDLRRTVETRLAAAGISREVRAQLQSHGLGGIQAKHYDRHAYRDEKRAALETLRALLDEPKPADVVPIKSAKKARAAR